MSDLNFLGLFITSP